MTRYTHQQFKELLEKKYSSQFTLLSKYEGSEKDILVKCNACGLVTEKGAAKLLYRGKCKGCAIKKHTKTHGQFQAEIIDKYKDDFALLGRYTHNSNKILVRHNVCGAEYEIMAESLLVNGGCKHCQSYRMRKKFAITTEEFKGHIKKLSENEYSVLGEYVNANTKIQIKHNKCGNIYLVRPNSFIRGSRCPKCAIEKRKTKDVTNRKIARNIRSRIIHLLQGRKKSAPTLELLGCYINELRLYLEGQFLPSMNWDNYGLPGGWQIDHIRPCASFDLRNKQQQKECFHYTNLQPLWAEENTRKHSWWNGVHYKGDMIAK